MKRQKRIGTRAMRAAGGTHQPSEASAYARKKERRARYAKALGYEPATPFPVMGVKDSRTLGYVELPAAVEG